MSEWKAIDTAPRDGTSILVIVVGYEPAVAKYVDGRFIYCEECAYNVDDHGNDWPLTHWQPLPAPPESTSAARG